MVINPENISTNRLWHRLPKKIIGVRFSAILEVLAFLSVLVLFDHLFGDGKRFIDYKIHPFWVIILLVTVQYGSLEGIMATVLSTLFLYVGNVPIQKPEETHFDYELKLALVPTLWFITAFILGEMRTRQERDKQAVQKELDLALIETKTITESYESLRQVKESLEIILAGQLRTSTLIYKTLKSLSTLNPNLIILNLEKVVQPILNPRKFSIYTLGVDGLQPVTCYGWGDEEKYVRRFPVDTALYRAIVGKQHLLCVINPEDEKILGKEGIVAAPLIDPETGEIFGMIKVEEMDFFELNIINLETFKTLCELIGLAYAHAREYQKTESRCLYSFTDLLFSYSFYLIQIDYLKRLAQMNHFPLTQMVIEEKKTEPDTEEALFCLLLQEILPKTIQLFHGKKRVGEFIVIFPGLTAEQVEPYTSLILNALKDNEILAHKQLSFHIQPLYVPL